MSINCRCITVGASVTDARVKSEYNVLENTLIDEYTVCKFSQTITARRRITSCHCQTLNINEKERWKATSSVLRAISWLIFVYQCHKIDERFFFSQLAWRFASTRSLPRVINWQFLLILKRTSTPETGQPIMCSRLMWVSSMTWLQRK